MARSVEEVKMGTPVRQWVKDGRFVAGGPGRPRKWPHRRHLDPKANEEQQRGSRLAAEAAGRNSSNLKRESAHPHRQQGGR